MHRLNQITTAFQFNQIMRFASFFICSIYLAKSGLTTSEIGIYETILLFVSSISFFWINGLLTTFLKQYSSEQNKQETTSFVFIALLLTCLLLLFFLILLKNTFIHLYHIPEHLYFITLLFFVCNSISFLTEYLWLVQSKIKQLYISGIINFVILQLCIAIPVFLFENIESVVFGLLAFSILRFILLIVILFQFKIKKWSIANILQFYKQSGYLILTYFLGGMIIYVNGFLVNYFFDKHTFAVYQYGAKELPITLLLANSLSQIMVSKISAQSAVGISELKKRTTSLMHWLFPISIVFILISKISYPFIFNDQFAESFIYFNIYILMIIPRCIFPQTILIANGSSKSLLYISIIEFAMNIFLSLLFLQLFGIIGIVVATVVSFVIEKIMQIYLLNKRGIRINMYLSVRPFVLYSTILLITFYIFTFLF